MALTAKLQPRLSQSLAMTPQLLQSIKLLQLSHLDLAAFVASEIEKNPLLETTETGVPEEEEPYRAEETDSGPGEAEGATPEADRFMDGGLATSEAAMEERLGTSVENLFDRESPSASAAESDKYARDRTLALSPSGHAPIDEQSLETRLAGAASLIEHLRGQAAAAFASGMDLAIAAEIIGSIDDDGYLRRPLLEIADAAGAPPGRVEHILTRIQQFDPSGIAARSVGECLALQLAERNRLDPAMQMLLAHLDLLAEREFAALKRLCGVDADDFAGMVREIRQLDPRPGSRFSAGPSVTVVPDVLIRPRAEGGWSIELNPETLPRVLVNREYHAQISRSARSEADRSFFANCLQNANWLVKSLDQRAQTVLKVATEIVRQQDMFLALGAGHLRPLNLKAVADAIKMHESTVSRVTSNKYMLTHRGLFEMKYFFTTAISGVDGETSHSSASVRHRIRQLVEAEAAPAVLSDDSIVELLRQGGIDIARRTVAKYREAMNIPSSVQRRREKNAAMAGWPDRDTGRQLQS